MNHCEIWLQEEGEIFKFSFPVQIKDSKVVAKRERSTTIIFFKSIYFSSALSVLFDKETF